MKNHLKTTHLQLHYTNRPIAKGFLAYRQTKYQDKSYPNGNADIPLGEVSNKRLNLLKAFQIADNFREFGLIVPKLKDISQMKENTSVAVYALDFPLEIAGIYPLPLRNLSPCRNLFQQSKKFHESGKASDPKVDCPLGKRSNFPPSHLG